MGGRFWGPSPFLCLPSQTSPSLGAAGFQLWGRQVGHENPNSKPLCQASGHSSTATAVRKAMYTPLALRWTWPSSVLLAGPSHLPGPHERYVPQSCQLGNGEGEPRGPPCPSHHRPSSVKCFRSVLSVSNYVQECCCTEKPKL